MPRPSYVQTEDDRARLGALRELNATRLEAEQQVLWQVQLLRSHGVPWSMIGAELGVSPQAAQQRFGK